MTWQLFLFGYSVLLPKTALPPPPFADKWRQQRGVAVQVFCGEKGWRKCWVNGKMYSAKGAAENDENL